MINKLLLSTAALALLTMGAHAADLMMEAPVAPVIAPEPAGWDGAYIGASIGYGPGTFTYDDCDGEACSIDFSGFFGGIQGGYNFTAGDSGVVLGIEGDANWANESGTADYGFGESDQVGVTFTGSITGHVGVAVGNVMPYALGGVAFARGYDVYTEGDAFPGGPVIAALAIPAGDDSAQATHVGYTVGAGLAAMFTDHLSGFIEGRYSDYGSATYSYENGFFADESNSLKDTTVKVGLNYHF